MQIKVSGSQFYIFFIDKSMFSLRICRYAMGKLMIEVLNTVKFNQWSQGSLANWDLTPKNCPGGGDLTIFENFPEVARGDGNA